ncbi:Rad52/Rad22 family DNA repair protein [Nonomuraea sp. NPDC003707]
MLGTTKLARKPRRRGFLRRQIRQLLQPIDTKRVLRDGKGHSHISQQDGLAHLNRIFGFGNWDTDLLRLDLVFETERVNKPGRWDVCYRAVVRLTIKDPDGNVMCHFENGTAETAMNQVRGDAHELAMKSAISVATKRAAIPLGDQFGLSLYNKGQTDALVRSTLIWPESTPEEMAATQEAQSSEEQGDIQAHVPEQVSLGHDEGDRPLNGDSGPSLLSKIIIAISGATSLDQMNHIGNQIDAEIKAGHISAPDEQAIGAVFMPKRQALVTERDAAHQAESAQAGELAEVGT